MVYRACFQALRRMPPLREKASKRSIVEAAQALAASGLSPGRSGNISVRVKGGMLITASGIPPAEMTTDDVVFVSASGESGGVDNKAPSTEWRFHLAAYATRASAGSVVHCHSRFATALACLHKAIPAFHYMVAKAGGEDIPLVPYAPYGTQALADAVAAALGMRKACLLANHGQVATGETLDDAVELAHEVETLASQYCTALMIAEPVLLSREEMTSVVEKFMWYGKSATATVTLSKKKR